MQITASQESGFSLANVSVADSFFTRFKGLMLRKGLTDQEGLLLTKTSRIHTNFMRFTIDVVYLDETFKVLAVESVKPWRLGKRVKGAVQVLEVAETKASALEIGETLSLQN